MTIISIRQPGYLPHLGFFKKIQSVDEFVFLETNPNSPVAQIKDDPRIHRMSVDTTGLLLGAEVFDSYVTLRDNGAVGKVR